MRDISKIKLYILRWNLCSVFPRKSRPTSNIRRTHRVPYHSPEIIKYIDVLLATFNFFGHLLGPVYTKSVSAQSQCCQDPSNIEHNGNTMSCSRMGLQLIREWLYCFPWELYSQRHPNTDSALTLTLCVNGPLEFSIFHILNTYCQCRHEHAARYPSVMGFQHHQKNDSVSNLIWKTLYLSITKVVLTVYFSWIIWLVE